MGPKTVAEVQGLEGVGDPDSIFEGDEPGEGSEVTTADLVDEPAIVINGDASL